MQNRKRGKSGVCVYSSQKAGKQGEKRGYQKREWGKSRVGRKVESKLPSRKPELSETDNFWKVSAS